ncbi:MAG: hypothetical protein SFX73_21845 [Kofleriaceae bacterium]|nr:hypothetical protein [Kofleriaceae bacterium]
MRPPRRVHRAPDFTSLLDVLFVVIFALLIRTAAVHQAAAKVPESPAASPPPAPATPQPPPDVVALRMRALSDLEGQLASRKPLVIRVSATGTIEALELDGKRTALDMPLLEGSADPDVGVAYLGDRSAELRLCRIAAVHLRLPDLAGHLVIVAPSVPLADLPHALHRGLHRDLDRCLVEQRGIATIVAPGSVTP